MGKHAGCVECALTNQLQIKFLIVESFFLYWNMIQSTEEIRKGCLWNNPVSNKGPSRFRPIFRKNLQYSLKSWITSLTTNNRIDCKGQRCSSLHETQQTQTEIEIRLERKRIIKKGRERETTTAAAGETKLNRNPGKEGELEGSTWWFIYVLKPILHCRPCSFPNNNRW